MHLCVCVCVYGKYQNTKINWEGILIYWYVCVYAWYWKTLKSYPARRMTYPQTHIWIPSLKLGIHMHVCKCVCGYDKNKNSNIYKALIHIQVYECVCACECESDFFQSHWVAICKRVKKAQGISFMWRTESHCLYVYCTGMHERIRIYGYTYIYKSDATNADVSARRIRLRTYGFLASRYCSSVSCRISWSDPTFIWIRKWIIFTHKKLKWYLE